MTPAAVSQRARVVLAVLGGLLTPIATGLSLAVLPFLAPFGLYLLAGAGGGYWQPKAGWRVGLWLTLGLILVTGAVALAALVTVAFVRRDADGAAAVLGRDGFVRVTLVFAGLPGAVGSCVGGNMGAALARLRGR